MRRLNESEPLCSRGGGGGVAYYESKARVAENFRGSSIVPSYDPRSIEHRSLWKAENRGALVAKFEARDYDLARKSKGTLQGSAFPLTVRSGGRLVSVMQKQKAVFLAFSMVIFAGCLAASIRVAAQEQSNKIIPNTVWVGADGKFESEPDTALVQFNISAQEKKLQDASQKASEQAEQIRQLLRSNGIDPKDAEFSRFTTQLVYDYSNGKQKPIGYRVTADISIKLKDFSKIGPINDGLSSLDVTNTSISYLLENMDAAKIKAVQDALRKTHDEANAVAQAGGRALGELSYASVDTFEQQPVRPMRMKAQMAAPEPPPSAEFGAEKISVTAHVNALYNLK